MKTVVLVVTTLLALSGCSNTPADPSPGAAGTGTAQFGKSVAFESGIEVTVSVPVDFKPSPSAYVENPTEQYVAFDVTVANPGSAMFDVSAVYFVLVSGGTEAEEVFDAAKHLEGVPGTALKPGAKTSFKMAFTAPDPGDLSLRTVTGESPNDQATFQP